MTGTSARIEEFVHSMMASTTYLIHGTPPLRIVQDIVAPAVTRLETHEELRERVAPLRRLVASAETEAAASLLTRNHVAYGLHETSLLIAPISAVDDQAKLARMNEKLNEILQQDPPPRAISGVRRRVTQREVDQALIDRQMVEVLRDLLAGAILETNNILTASGGKLADAERKRVRLFLLARENLHRVDERDRVEVLEALEALAESFAGLEMLNSLTASLVRKVQAMARLSMRSRDQDTKINDVMHLFIEGGMLQHISLTLVDLLEGLQEADQGLLNLNGLAERHGHIIPRDVLPEGLFLLQSLTEGVQKIREWTSITVDVFRLLRSIVEGYGEHSPGSVDLHRHLNKRLIGAVMGKVIHVELDLDPGFKDEPWRIAGPAIRVWHVILNLIANARHAMGKEGMLTISTRKVRRREGEFVVLRFQHTGSGISSTEDSDLAITLKIVKQAGGFMTIETSQSEPFQNIVSVYWPRVE